MLLLNRLAFELTGHCVLAYNKFPVLATKDLETEERYHRIFENALVHAALDTVKHGEIILSTDSQQNI
jgi:hypothetical protein